MTAIRFAWLLIAQYLVAAVLFGGAHNWKKALYFIACAIKDVAVILL